MSHPEGLSPAGGGSASTVSKPPSANGNGGGQTLADFAIGHGLSQSAARPPIRQYLVQEHLDVHDGPARAAVAGADTAAQRRRLLPDLRRAAEDEPRHPRLHPVP